MSELGEKAAQLEKRLAELEDFFDVETLRRSSTGLAEEMSRPGFWDEPEEARKVSAEFSRVENRVKMLDGLRARLADAEELLELAEEDERLIGEVREEFGRIEKTLEEQEVARLFSGEYDEGAAILTINSGAGGVDSQDWAEMLARMYRRWAERRGYDLEVLLVHLDLDSLADDRGYRHRGEARVPPPPGVERAYAHEPVYPPLGGQQAEGVLAGDGVGGALDPGLLAQRVLDGLDAVPVPLGPAPVHPGEHLRPVLRVDPALAGVDGEDGVALVVGSAEEPRYLLLLERTLDPLQLLADLVE